MRVVRAVSDGRAAAAMRTSPPAMAADSRGPPWSRMARPVTDWERAFTVLGRIWLRNTAPRPAMPVAIPTCRNVLDEPDAMPLRSGGTTDTVADANTGLRTPIPMPARMNPGSRTVHDEVA